MKYREIAQKSIDYWMLPKHRILHFMA